MNPLSSQFIFVLIILALVVFGLYLFRKHFKALNITDVYLVTGGVKTGKTFLSVSIAIKEYRKTLIRYYICSFFQKLIHVEVDRKPEFYTNLPIAKIHYKLITKDILLRKTRIAPKSVVLIDETSLLADSMSFKDKEVNNNLLLFVKLFGHYSHGGRLILNTQALSDNHYAIKRCLSRYLYIYSRLKLPFITIMNVRELMYSDDGSLNSMNTFGDDVELSMRKIVVLNSTYKRYDCYSLSSFTDYKPFDDNLTFYKSVKDDLKVYNLVTFQSFAIDMNTEMAEYLENREKLLKQAESEVSNEEVI